jgi:2-polyprenyl-3-methyl-5-hydroxy-6-metoxy-1,4-benzoquinol methylase
VKNFSDQKIVDSWMKNVQPWVQAVRCGEIESRLLVTNKSITDAIFSRTPKSVLDVGCGEGWLSRELAKSGIQTLGIDIVPSLIDFARKAGGGRFECMPMSEVTFENLHEKFDTVACNFSLLGNESVDQLFRNALSLLQKGGALIIQTIHPMTGCGDGKYEDGWREGSWAGFNDQFSDPAPWYFRTMESWKVLFTENGYRLCNTLEPLNPKTNLPASVIFIGEVDGQL